LLSFIICFGRDAWYHRPLFLRLLALVLAVMAYCLTEDLDTVDLKMLIPVFSVGLFICSMVCHGELARLKPHPRYLTSYYLMIALGGALGGVLVGFTAPQLLGGFYELPVAIAACGTLALIVLFRDPGTPLYRGGQPTSWVVILGVYAAILVGLVMGVQSSVEGYRVRERNFYGSLRVGDEGVDEMATRKLMHGSINHGEQFLDPGRSRTATTYYGKGTGVGLALLNSGRQPQRVGVIGLGVGTLATYGRKGDYYRFYEINPEVIRLARSEFRFLEESAAQVDIALGDARLSLEREPPQQFDVLAVDAFSGDSIPVHLLTREAFQVYFRHLKPDGILAVHVSNRYLELEPVVERIATALGRRSLAIDTEDDSVQNVFGATWVVVSGRPGLFDQEVFRRAGIRIQPRPNLRMWTDDYSNLVEILK
jgi:SAM-dependent methyltransferase